MTDRFDVRIEVSAMVTGCFFVPVDAVAVRKHPPLILFPLVIRINHEYLEKNKMIKQVLSAILSHVAGTGYKCTDYRVSQISTQTGIIMMYLT